MVWQVKFVSICLALLVLLGAGCTVAQAATYEIYDGNPSNTYIQYFKDSISNIGLRDNYVAFRSGQYEYTMVVGDISYNSGVFSSVNSCIVYTLESDNSYNGYYSYSQSTIENFYLNAEDKILYSNLGGYPQLDERGSKYEILTAILIVVVCVGYVVRNIFYSSSRCIR